MHLKQLAINPAPANFLLVYFSEPDMAELRFCHAAGPLGHVCVVFCGENMGWEGRTIPTAY